MKGHLFIYFLQLFILIRISCALPVTPSNSSDSLAHPNECKELQLFTKSREKRQVAPPYWPSQYYDFAITETSFKFWSAFELVTCAILLYSTFAAIYYARWVWLNPQFDPDAGLPPDDFLERKSRSLLIPHNLSEILERPKFP